jgi:hypothetical protein
MMIFFQPHLQDYAKDYVQIMVACPYPSYSIFPHTYDNCVMRFIDSEVVER